MADAKPARPVSPTQTASGKTFLSPLGAPAETGTGKVPQSQIDGPQNVAVKAFRLLLHRAQHSRDESGQPASFQYTLWFMMALVIVVTILGVVLLEQASRRQRAKLTSTTAEDEAVRTTAPASPQREDDSGVITKKVGRWVTEGEEEPETTWSSPADPESTESRNALRSTEYEETAKATDADAATTTSA